MFQPGWCYLVAPLPVPHPGQQGRQSHSRLHRATVGARRAPPPAFATKCDDSRLMAVVAGNLDEAKPRVATPHVRLSFAPHPLRDPVAYRRPASHGVPITFEEGLPSPKTWHIWSMAQHAVALHRTSERQVELSIVDGAMLDSVFEQNFRNPNAAVAVGLQVPLEGQRLTVLEVNEGRPVRVRFDFELPPEAFSFVWWNGAVLERLQLPAVGERRVLPRVPTIFDALLTGAQVE